MEVTEILSRIEENGFEAYIVGGYVRDHILGIESTDIDICTNAKVKDILDIFSDVNVTSNEYGAVKMITNKAKIGTIPLDIGIPISDIGIVAKSAIIIATTNSKG